MKKKSIIFIVIAAIITIIFFLVTESFEKNEKDAANLTGTPSADIDKKIVDKTLNLSLLDGEWVFDGGETDGMEYTAEESGIESEISILNNIAKYFVSTGYENKQFVAELEFIEEPLYSECINDIWSVQFKMKSGDFGEDEEFYATLIDEDTLLLQQFYPFDGTQGVSYQTYKRK